MPSDGKSGPAARPPAVETWLQGLPSEARKDSERELRALAGDVVKRKAQFLCGAGLSKGSGLPLGSDLAPRLVGEMLDGGTPDGDRRKALQSLAERFPLEAIAEAYRATLDKAPLVKFGGLINDELKHGQEKLHAGHYALEYLASNGYINKLYTTNFDTLLETALGGRGTAVTDDNAENVPDLLVSDKIPVLHLHGVVGGKCRLAESDTYSLDTPLARFLAADMVSDRFVWIGYSFGDMDLRMIYLSTRDVLRQHDSHKRPFIVHPLGKGDDGHRYDEWRLATRVWNARGGAYIPGSAEEALPALVDQVRRFGTDALVRAIVSKQGGNPDDPLQLEPVWKEVRAMMADLGDTDEGEALRELARKYKALV